MVVVLLYKVPTNPYRCPASILTLLFQALRRDIRQDRVETHAINKLVVLVQERPQPCEECPRDTYNVRSPSLANHREDFRQHVSAVRLIEFTQRPYSRYLSLRSIHAAVLFTW